MKVPKGRVKQLVIPLYGETLNVQINMDVPLGVLEDIDSGDLSAIKKVLQELVVNWDLVDDDNNIVPLTDEGLRSLGMFFVGDVLTAIMEHVGQGK